MGGNVDVNKEVLRTSTRYLGADPGNYYMTL